MASSYTFKDFLARLERSNLAHIKPQYFQNQMLFMHRPDMLVQAASELSYAKGFELLKAAKFAQEVPVDAHRAVLAQMLKHNGRQQREQSGHSPAMSSDTTAADWRVALEVFRDAHITYGNQTPSRVYLSALKLLGPTRQWEESVKVLKLRQQVSEVTAPMLVAAAVCHATPERHLEAIRLLRIAEAAMPSYFNVTIEGSDKVVNLKAMGELRVSASDAKSSVRRLGEGTKPVNKKRSKSRAVGVEEEDGTHTNAEPNPFSLMPPERQSELGLSSLTTPRRSSSALTPLQQAAQEATALMSLAHVLAATPWEAAKQEPLLRGAIEVILNRGADRRKLGTGTSDDMNGLEALNGPLPVTESLTVGYLPSDKGLQMQRELLPLALANVPWGAAIELLFGGGSVSWTPALLASMLAKAPDAQSASKLASLLPQSFMRHRDTALSLAQSQLAKGAHGGVGAEHALRTLLASSVAAAATSSLSAESNSQSGMDGLLPTYADSARPFPSELMSSIVLTLWSNGRWAQTIEAANLCMVTKSKLTTAAIVAALECAVKGWSEFAKSGLASNATVHWKTAVTWALQLQLLGQGHHLSMADRNLNDAPAVSSEAYGAQFLVAATSSLEAAVTAQQKAQLIANSGAKYQSRWSDAAGGGSASSNDLAFIPDRGPPLHHRMLSLLIHLCAVQKAPLAAIRLIGYASANGNIKLPWNEEVKALLYCAMYDRPQEGRLIVEGAETRAAKEDHGQAAKPLRSLYAALFTEMRAPTAPELSPLESPAIPVAEERVAAAPPTPPPISEDPDELSFDHYSYGSFVEPSSSRRSERSL